MTFKDSFPTQTILWYGISLWSVRGSCPSCVPSQTLAHPQPACWWGSVRNRKPWGYASTVQQYPKHRCVFNAVLITNLKHGTMWATMKKIKSIPTRSSSYVQLLTEDLLSTCQVCLWTYSFIDRAISSLQDYYRIHECQRLLRKGKSPLMVLD